MFYVCIMVLLNSGIFPEIAWRAILSRQAAHPFEHVLWGFWVQRLAVNACTARRLKLKLEGGVTIKYSRVKVILEYKERCWRMKDGSHSCCEILGICHIYLDRLAARALPPGAITEVGVFTGCDCC
ncbi:hypothetical protein DEO72_LG2g4114 [Vigna unguiculata]|uniref:Uncharacterized protein n=1 Tax=Vigna unguiculata TaxID=3917 RepID=A0A4D6L5H6_VIGUN|nr:hypothetical protein DEO72_LG2g4114 [Vigna unguiculata]